DRAALDPAMDQRLGTHEDVEPEPEIGLERLPGGIADLEPDKVGSALAETPEHVEGSRVSTAAGELVDVERKRRARSSGGREVRELSGFVELEVRRAGHCNRRCAGVRAGGRPH